MIWSIVRSKASALLSALSESAPDRTRTCNLTRIRNPALIQLSFGSEASGGDRTLILPGRSRVLFQFSFGREYCRRDSNPVHRLERPAAHLLPSAAEVVPGVGLKPTTTGM